MSEKPDKLKEKGRGIIAWCGRHKAVSIIIVALAAGLFYNNVIAKNNPLGSGTGASADQVAQGEDLLTKNAKAFIEEYGCYSYMDALDSEEMEKYAHEDLCRAVVGERVASYMYPGEAFDEPTSRAVASDRMRILGLVKVCDLKSMTLLGQETDLYQIRAEVDEFTFTNDKGMQKAGASYILEVRKNEGAGTDSPYEVTRIFKE
jgi:hypothetical protein